MTTYNKSPLCSTDWVDIRHYLEKLIEERDRLYDTRFKAAETAVSAALAAQEKSTASAFAASEKAVLKAESAQADYNSRSNEFRGQLDDQAKTLMPRMETQGMVKMLEEKLETVKSIASKDVDILRADIASLRESRSGSTAKDIALQGVRVQSNWSTGLVAMVGLSILSSIISWGIAIALYFARK